MENGYFERRHLDSSNVSLYVHKMNNIACMNVCGGDAIILNLFDDNQVVQVLNHWSLWFLQKHLCSWLFLIDFLFGIFKITLTIFQKKYLQAGGSDNDDRREDLR